MNKNNLPGMLNNFLDSHKDLDIIFLCKFGSHLYGTSTEKSDEDYKGVFLPTKEQCYLNDVPKTVSFKSHKGTGKNTDEDVDIEVYSLHYYLKLLQKGDTGALDMLHAPLDNADLVLAQSDIWKHLNGNRTDFYTTNLSAFVGYCRTQASKYGIKGSRLNDAKSVLDFLDLLPSETRLNSIWDDLPKGEHIHKIAPDLENKSEFRLYQVCGKKLQETVTVAYAYDVVDRFYMVYGKRAQLAAKNKGIDWKAVSHALRCAYEMKQIYAEGCIEFPLKEASQILKVKNGELDYTSQVAPLLEKLMEEVELLCEKSCFPKKVNIKKYNQWLIRTISLSAREL